MLVSLTIRDLAVVTNLNLELSPGLTVLTGETGAGKSILLTAIALALGDRADTDYIRTGAQKAEIELFFDTSDSHFAQSWLEEQELDEENSCIIRRQITTDGRSKAWINGRATTLKSLQTLSEKLVEVHGQHAHLSLLQSAEQLRLLDVSAQTKTSRQKVADLARRWQTTNQELMQLSQENQNKQAREELLRYQVQELEALNISELDYPSLENEHRKLANIEKILITGQQQLEQLYDRDQLSANALLGQSLHALEELEQLAPELGEATRLLNESQIQLQEAVSTMRNKLDLMEADPKQFNWIEEQLGLLLDLARKHGTTPNALPEQLVLLSKELQSSQHSSEKEHQLQERLEQLRQDYDNASTRLTQQRTNAAHTLQNKITTIIKELGMPHGNFLIQVKTDDTKTPHIDGNDKIEFLISANPDMPPRPLAKVASGGELSRISLAIQVAAAGSKRASTLIFDEVDSGIGGGVAEIVGQRLLALSSDRQVLCVTHLPQVASQGNHHLLIEKTSTKEKTETTVKGLSKHDRVNEIARMLGGIKMTNQTYAHAKEMLGED